MVIDNFLPKDTFKAIKDICTSQEMAWYRSDGISNNDSTNAIVNPLDNYYFVHLIFLDYTQTSNHFNLVKDAFTLGMKEHLGQGFRNISRIKINLYPRTEEVQVHPFHSDSKDQEGLQGALLCINTCDGYTGFEDGTEVDSVENRVIFFDSTKPHHSTSCSNAAYRLNINVNYL